ncbi:hypothetical protein THAOC_25910, partial [Thalassiosira oceanica]
MARASSASRAEPWELGRAPERTSDARKRGGDKKKLTGVDALAPGRRRPEDADAVVRSLLELALVDRPVPRRDRAGPVELAVAERPFGQRSKCREKAFRMGGTRWNGGDRKLTGVRVPALPGDHERPRPHLSLVIPSDRVFQVRQKDQTRELGAPVHLAASRAIPVPRPSPERSLVRLHLDRASHPPVNELPRFPVDVAAEQVAVGEVYYRVLLLDARAGFTVEGVLVLVVLVVEIAARPAVDPRQDARDPVHELRPLLRPDRRRRPERPVESRGGVRVE